MTTSPVKKTKLPQQIIYSGVIAGALLFGPKWGNFWAFTQATLGGVVALAGVGQLKRHEEGKDVPVAPWQFLKSGVVALGEEYVEIRRIVVERLPEPLADLVNVTEVVGIESEAKFRELHRYSLLIIGQTNAGKTWFQHQSAILSLEEQAKGGTMRVFDLTPNKRGFNWHGLPHGKIIFSDLYNDLPKLLDEAVETRNQRRKEAREGIRNSWPKYILHLAEFNNSLQEYIDWYEQLDDDEKVGIQKPKRLLFKVKSLLTDGHGHEVFIVFDLQTLAVGETNLNLAMLGQANICIRGSTAINTTELGKVLGKDAKAWADKVAAARKASGNPHISIAIIERQPSLFVPPDLASIAQITIAPGAELTPSQVAQQWAQGYIESISAAKSPTEAFNLLKEHMPSGYTKQSSDNPYYQAIKELSKS